MTPSASPTGSMIGIKPMVLATTTAVIGITPTLIVDDDDHRHHHLRFNHPCRDVPLIYGPTRDDYCAGRKQTLPRL
jgi:hypothetical protein